MTLQSLSQDCFDSLLKLLGWSWNTYNVAMSEVHDLKGDNHKAAISDLTRLVYISTASLRLIKIYINEVYPDGGRLLLAHRCFF